jgi:short-subunit dehydrogenase
MEFRNSPIAVTTLYPGYIRSEMSSKAEQATPLMSSTEDGVRAMVAAIEREVSASAVPPWPWKPLGLLMRYAPASLVRRFA